MQCRVPLCLIGTKDFLMAGKMLCKMRLRTTNVNENKRNGVENESKCAERSTSVNKNDS